jgi:hypothetical protein
MLFKMKGSVSMAPNDKPIQVPSVDIAIFMGQSNMAGRGVASEAPKVPSGYGYEFRAISDATKLYDIVEPFGVNENDISGINEPGMKTGSLVSSFIINYYETTGVPLVCVSASKGGSSINKWQPGERYIEDAINRFETMKTYLNTNGYTIRRKFMVWCQGETDGDHNMSEVEYKSKLQNVIEAMMITGIEKCFLIRIGNHRDLPEQYHTIMNAQTNFCSHYQNAVLVSTQFEKMASLGLMKDPFHYKQEAYNIVGEEAGENTAAYIKHYKASDV